MRVTRFYYSFFYHFFFLFSFSLLFAKREPSISWTVFDRVVSVLETSNIFFFFLQLERSIVSLSKGRKKKKKKEIEVDSKVRGKKRL